MSKFHKEGIPRRPVISLVNYKHYHLQAIVREIPPFIKDTNDLPCKLNLLQKFQKILTSLNLITTEVPENF